MQWTLNLIIDKIMEIAKLMHIFVSIMVLPLTGSGNGLRLGTMGNTSNSPQQNNFVSVATSTCIHASHVNKEQPFSK